MQVRTESTGPNFSLPFITQARSARAMKTRKEKNKGLELAVRTEQTRLKKSLLYGFAECSGFEKVIES